MYIESQSDDSQIIFSKYPFPYLDKFEWATVKDRRYRMWMPMRWAIFCYKFMINFRFADRMN